MKAWQSNLLFFFAGMIVTAGVLLILNAPRSASVELAPVPTLAPLLVQVEGEVARPGLYALPPGSRIEDAIEAAGGCTARANRAALNLAAKAADGMKIVVSQAGQTPAEAPPQKSSPKILSATPQAALINLNTATLDEFDTLPGIGLTRAQDIITYREAHNGFKTIEELKEVPGIGDATFERLKNLVTVDPLP